MAMEDTRSVTTGDVGKEATVPAGIGAAFYKSRTGDREAYLTRARRCAGLTMPALFRDPNTQSKGEDKELPWNSIGAYLITNLGAKVVRSMFPVGRPPMKLGQDRSARRDLTELEATDPAQAQELKTQIDQGLSLVEGEFSEAMEEDGDRARLSIAVLKMLCGGNHGLQFYPDGTIRGIGLEHFVTERDPSGRLLRWAVEDPMKWDALPLDVQKLCQDNGYSAQPDAVNKPEVCVFTYGEKRQSIWHVHQETYGQIVPGSQATYNEEAIPYLFLPWLLIDGEDYGRSYAEFYEADLDLVDGLTKTVAEGSAAVARFLTLVNPTGLTSRKQLAEAQNGDVISGRADDVHVVQNNKGGDFATADNLVQQVVQRLARAFLVTSAVVRQAERVTAEEVYRVAQELEEVLGGVYSEQVVTFQIPYVAKKMRYLMQQGRVTKLPKGTVSFKVIGGAAALGRNSELMALDQYIGGALQTLGPQMILQAINPREYMARRAAALGIETAGLVYTEEQAAANQQQTQQQTMIDKFGPEMLRQFGQNLTSRQVAETNADAKIATSPQPTVQ